MANNRRLLKASIATTVLMLSGSALAAGFIAPVLSTTELSVANAGSAASAENATTAYDNPAGIVRLDKQQLVVSVMGIANNTRFNGTVTPGLAAPLTGSASSNFAAALPDIYYTAPLDGRMFFGLSLTSPYGLGDSYPSDSIARYDIITAEDKSIDIGPSLAYKITDEFSAGFGFDALYFNAHETYAASLYPYAGADAQSKLTASGWGYGLHGGLLYQFTPATRVGLNYHSQIAMTLEGNSQVAVNDSFVPFILPDGVVYVKGTEVSATLPPTTQLSLSHDLNNQWTVLGSVELQQWSVFNNEHFTNVAGPFGPIAVSNLPQDFKDTWRLAGGALYQICSQWQLRAGVAYDQAATNDMYRDLSIPDAPAYDVAVGAHYQPTQSLGLDAGYMHIFYQTADINTTTPTATIVGTAKPMTNAVGLQATWTIG